MHELAITRSLLNLTLARAELAGAVKVSAVHVALGELSGLVPECIDLYWAELTRGTAAEGSRVEYRAIPALLSCSACGSLTQFHTGQRFGCQHCWSQELKLHSGDEIMLEALDAVLKDDQVPERESDDR